MPFWSHRHPFWSFEGDPGPHLGEQLRDIDESMCVVSNSNRKHATPEELKTRWDSPAFGTKETNSSVHLVDHGNRPFLEPGAPFFFMYFTSATMGTALFGARGSLFGASRVAQGTTLDPRGQEPPKS